LFTAEVAEIAELKITRIELSAHSAPSAVKEKQA
jgi:hypothetical protein